jgi:hypothetical protein
MLATHENWQTGVITEVEVPDIQMREFEYQSPTVVDRVEYAGDFVKGYLADELVVTFEGVSDISALKLLDARGHKVEPVPALPDDTTLLQLAFAELLEANHAPTARISSFMAASDRPEPTTNTSAIAALYAELVDKGLRTPEQFKEIYPMKKETK